MMVKGKDIQTVRSGMKLNQPRFARWLSEQTGEAIDSKALCRMESFGKTGACRPIKPSPAVVTVVSQSTYFKKKTDSVNTVQRNVDETTIKRSGQVVSNSSSTEIPKMLTQDEKEKLKELINLYQELGVFEASGDTATDIIESVTAHIQELEINLFGQGGSSLEKHDLEQQLWALEEEEKQIDAQLQKVNDEIEHLSAMSR